MKAGIVEDARPNQATMGDGEGRLNPNPEKKTTEVSRDEGEGRPSHTHKAVPMEASEDALLKRRFARL